MQMHLRERRMSWSQRCQWMRRIKKKKTTWYNRICKTLTKRKRNWNSRFKAMKGWRWTYMSNWRVTEGILWGKKEIGKKKNKFLRWNEIGLRLSLNLPLISDQLLNKREIISRMSMSIWLRKRTNFENRLWKMMTNCCSSRRLKETWSKSNRWSQMLSKESNPQMRVPSHSWAACHA